MHLVVSSPEIELLEDLGVGEDQPIHEIEFAEDPETKDQLTCRAEFADLGAEGD